LWCSQSTCSGGGGAGTGRVGVGVDQVVVHPTPHSTRSIHRVAGGMHSVAGWERRWVQAAGCRLQAAGCVVLPRRLLDLLHLVGDPVAVLVEPAW
jgi:hypothetical protein